jgi:hypothetical protein
MLSILLLDSISCIEKPAPRALAPVELRSVDGSLGEESSLRSEEETESRLGKLFNTWG